MKPLAICICFFIFLLVLGTGQSRGYQNVWVVSEAVLQTGFWLAPSDPTLQIHDDGQTYTIYEAVQNGQFIHNLDGWNTGGSVERAEDCSEIPTDAKSDSCVRIALTESSSWASMSTKLQGITSQQKPQLLQFRYRFTQVEAPITKEPVLQLFSGDRELTSIVVSEPTEWHTAFIPLRDHLDEDITFKATLPQSLGDLSLEIAYVTTAIGVLKPGSLLTLTTFDDSPSASVYLRCKNADGLMREWNGVSLFTLDYMQLKSGDCTYWADSPGATDATSESSARILVDLSPPDKISDLKTYDEHNEISLTFTSPSDAAFGNAIEYGFELKNVVTGATTLRTAQYHHMMGEVVFPLISGLPEDLVIPNVAEGLYELRAYSTDASAQRSLSSDPSVVTVEN